jgi:hypothetical protein
VEHKVRIGRLSDQDRWLAEDMARLSPDERVALLMKMRQDHFGTRAMASIERVVHIRFRSQEASEQCRGASGTDAPARL